MTGFRVDTSELDALGVELQQVGGKVEGALPGAARKSATKIRDDWRTAASKSRHFKIAETVTFDEKATADGYEAEIGPDRRFPAARLAGIAHFGGANGGGGTIGDPQRFADAEADGFAKAVADLVERAL